MNRIVTMTLLSDAIFGSGMSIPGGEDIAVKTDEQGAPYLSGSTFKGLLRESVENWLDWEQNPDSAAIVSALFGASENERENWMGSPNSRRVFVSPLTLAPGQNRADLLRQRTFTSIDPNSGTVKKGSLRVASCVRMGTVFQGTISCAAEDRTLVESALRCIKSLGTSRTRGFGQVCFALGDEVQTAAPAVQGTGRALRCTLELLEGVRVTDLNESHNTFLESRRWIPASALRGAVLGRLARRDPAWFEENKAVLLREVFFCDLIPGGSGEKPAIPVPMGFYEDKLGENFYSLCVRGDVIPGTKRAKLGSFCTLEEQGDKRIIRDWSPRLGAETRIHLDMQNSGEDKPGGLFQTGHLLPGQSAVGRICFSDKCSQALRNRVAEALCDGDGTLRLGANTHSGFGLCRVTELRWAEETPEAAAYGFRDCETIPKTLYLLLLSPLMLLDESGDPRAVDCALLETLLGVKVKELLCSTSVGQQHGFNRTMGTRLPVRCFYQRGCVFRIDCEVPPALERIRALERSGLGQCREEGWGRVLFLREMARIEGHCAQSSGSAGTEKIAEAVRRSARAQWLLDPDNIKKMKGRLSPSQLGSVQELLVRAAAEPEPEHAEDILKERFQHLKDKNPAERDKYRPIEGFIDQVRSGEALPETMGLRTERERLELLIDLIKVSRKEGKLNGRV